MHAMMMQKILTMLERSAPFEKKRLSTAKSPRGGVRLLVVPTRCLFAIHVSVPSPSLISARPLAIVQVGSLLIAMVVLSILIALIIGLLLLALLVTLVIHLLGLTIALLLAIALLLHGPLLSAAHL